MGRMAPTEAGLTLAEHYAAGADEGIRRELLDGVLIVSPFASARHALAAQRLNEALAAACPPDVLVLGTVNVDQEPATNLQPDLVVIRAGDIDLPATQLRPLLVVEILSPSTRRFDATVKRQVYAVMGIPAYWLVDITVPSIEVLGLSADGAYGERARVAHDEPHQVERPYPVTLRATDLLR
jgi:Uma2 family endonuclease